MLWRIKQAEGIEWSKGSGRTSVKSWNKNRGFHAQVKWALSINTWEWNALHDLKMQQESQNAWISESAKGRRVDQVWDMIQEIHFLDLTQSLSSLWFGVIFFPNKYHQFWLIMPESIHRSDNYERNICESILSNYKGLWLLS